MRDERRAGRPTDEWEWQSGEKSRVFVEPERLLACWDGDRTLSVEGEDGRHLARVLRLRPGDRVVAADGAGAECEARIEAVEADLVRGRGRSSDGSVRLRLLKMRPNRTEPPIELVLIQGLPKGEKMDLIVQKAVEVGATRVVPVVTRRAVPRYDEKKAADRASRWRRIAREAARQSRRGLIPAVEAVRTWEAAVEQAGSSLTADAAAGFVPWEMEGSTSLKGALAGCTQRPDCVYVCIGPEGGLTEQEVASARAAGFQSVGLGPRIFRTETAGLVAMSVVLAEWGDLV